MLQPKTTSLIDKNSPEKPLIRNSHDYMTDEEKVAYMERILDQVVTPGVIPDTDDI